jgi:sugar phosphate isomerase/epimerase
MERVVHVHVKDVIGSRCVALGTGTVRVEACVDLLRRHGYGGVLSLESEGGFEPEQGRRFIEQSLGFLKRVVGESR